MAIASAKQVAGALAFQETADVATARQVGAKLGVADESIRRRDVPACREQGG